MSLVAAGRKVVSATLVKCSADAPSYPGLERAGRKLARGLANVLTGLMSVPASVSASPVRIEEMQAGDAMELRHLRLAPPKGSIALAIGRHDVMRLVDLYYGGAGGGDATRDRLSPAESRLLSRIVGSFCNLLPIAFLPFGALTAEPEEEGPSDGGAAAIQKFTVELPDQPAFDIECGYPLALIEALPALRSGPAPDQEQADHDWQARLMNCALGIPFPVRAIFAEPELPLTKLIGLKPGDIIPVCAPAEIELDVSGLSFARGSAGESNGRAAIRIEQP